MPGVSVLLNMFYSSLAVGQNKSECPWQDSLISLIFESEARRLLRECYLTWFGSSFDPNIEYPYKNLDSDKRSFLFSLNINYKEKRLRLTPGVDTINFW